MGKAKTPRLGSSHGNSTKERHKRDRRFDMSDWKAPLPPGLVAQKERRQARLKHLSYLEWVENTDKKKKLHIETIEDRLPPPGFEFVPLGNPALTQACKELSREQDAVIYIVTSRGNGHSKEISLHMNRVGTHIRQAIVEQARDALGLPKESGAFPRKRSRPEPIPETQEEINAQADAAIRDLFPRIPNTDREIIIQHAFNKAIKNNGKDGCVGLAGNVPLTRRVQLAVLAHIRHNLTRYDELLKETSWVNSRKAVEPVCLDYLVKWRGDEENGRDQLDEVLREVVVISDSGCDADDDADDDMSSASSHRSASRAVENNKEDGQPSDDGDIAPSLEKGPRYATRIGLRGRRSPERRHARHARRGFKRYQAAQRAWHDAVERQRHGQSVSYQHRCPSPGRASPGRPNGHALQPTRALKPASADRIPHSRLGLYGTPPSVPSPVNPHGDLQASLPVVMSPISSWTSHDVYRVHSVASDHEPLAGAQDAMEVQRGCERTPMRDEDRSKLVLRSIEAPSPPERPQFQVRDVDLRTGNETAPQLQSDWYRSTQRHSNESVAREHAHISSEGYVSGQPPHRHEQSVVPNRLLYESDTLPTLDNPRMVQTSRRLMCSALDRPSPGLPVPYASHNVLHASKGASGAKQQYEPLRSRVQTKPLLNYGRTRMDYEYARTLPLSQRVARDGWGYDGASDRRQPSLPQVVDHPDTQREIRFRDDTRSEDMGIVNMFNRFPRHHVTHDPTRTSVFEGEIESILRRRDAAVEPRSRRVEEPRYIQTDGRPIHARFANPAASALRGRYDHLIEGPRCEQVIGYEVFPDNKQRERDAYFLREPMVRRLVGHRFVERMEPYNRPPSR